MDPILFDRARLRKRRARAAADFPAHDFLRREASARLAESLAVVTHRFPRIIELGGGLGLTREGTDAFIQCDLAEAMLRPLPGLRVVADEECLPFAENSADAVVSALSLHWVNDLPGALKQIFHVLKPDGLFLAVLFGAGTLRELRQVFAEVESERYGGVSPRIAPFVEVREAGALLQRAGFALPVAASETLTVEYPGLPQLLYDLKGMGEVNMLHGQRKNFTARGFFAEATSRYAAQHGAGDWHVKASFELITLTGWKPAPTQPQPARRGSGQVSLKDALN